MTIFDFSPEFFKWAVRDENIGIIGIRVDAPEHIKKEYGDYMIATHSYTKEGILIK